MKRLASGLASDRKRRPYFGWKGKRRLVWLTVKVSYPATLGKNLSWHLKLEGSYSIAAVKPMRRY